MSANALRNIVIGLGVLIIIAFAVAVWGIVDSSRRAGNGAAPLAEGELRRVDLGLPASCDVVSAQSDGERLVIVTGGTASSRERCSAVHVLDLDGGSVRMEVRP